MVPSSFGGYIAVGAADPDESGDLDIWLVKLDENGDTAWTRVFGGPGEDGGQCVQQTTDGGYVIVGYQDWDGDLNSAVVKTYPDGSVEWYRVHGDPVSATAFRHVQQTSEGGYVVAGYTAAPDLESDLQGILLRLDASGYVDLFHDPIPSYEAVWHDVCINWAEETPAHGYIAVGYFDDWDWYDDLWIGGADVNLANEWSARYELADDRSGAWSITPTSDGNYIVAGYRGYEEAELRDIWLRKADANGETLWAKTYGGSGNDNTCVARQTLDGGYIVAGYGDGTIAWNDAHGWLLKTDPSGDTTWTRDYESSGWAVFHGIQEISEDDFFVVGERRVIGPGLMGGGWVLRIAEDYRFDVLSVVPDHNELGVALDATVSITCDENIDAGTLTPISLPVRSQLCGAVPGVYTFNAPSQTMTFDPDNGFATGDLVTVTVTEAVRSSIGKRRCGGFSWSFLTASTNGTAVLEFDASYEVGRYPMSVFAADLNRDCVIDLVAASGSTYDITILLNPGGETFDTPVHYSACDSPRDVDAADLDGDGDFDVATVGVVVVYMNDGSGTMIWNNQYLVGDESFSIAAVDLDGNGLVDLATGNRDGNSVSVLFNDGSGNFGGRRDYSAGYHPFWLCHGDFDNDGDADLAVVNYFRDSVSVLLNHGDGTFAPKNQYVASDRCICIETADMDGDGDLDLITANDTENDVSVLRNNGDGSFALPSNYWAGSWVLSALPVDLNSDGHPDIVAVSAGGTGVHVLLNNGDGSLGYDGYYTVGLGPLRSTAADFDANGTIDVAVALRGADSVGILLNLSADMNGDGVLNKSDNCPTVYNPVQEDINEDGIRDVCDNTPEGSDVQVEFGENVDVTLSNVTRTGWTDLTESSTGPEPPEGFNLVPLNPPPVLQHYHQCLV